MQTGGLCRARLLINVAVLCGLLLTVAGPVAIRPAYAWHAQTGHWQLQLDWLWLNQLDESDDEPYVVVIGFSSQFGVTGSTRIIGERPMYALHEQWWDTREDARRAYISERMGVIDFGEIETSDHKAGVAGAIIVAMESDSTPWGTVDTIFDTAAEEVRRTLVTLIENEGFSLEGSGGSTKLADEIGLRLSEAFDRFDVGLVSVADPDDVVGAQVLIFFTGVEPTSPLKCGDRPWESGGVMLLGETTFDRPRTSAQACNSLRFDGSVLGDSPAFYEVSGRMTSITPRAGDLDQPRSNSNWWGSVDLSVDLCGGCHPVSAVRYFARYDKGDGRGAQDYPVANGDPKNGFRATWNIAGVPTQRATVRAELDTPVGTAHSSEHLRVGLNVDTQGPSGQITSPANGSVQGKNVRLTAQVADSQSGVDHVEFWYDAGSGRQDIVQHGTPANGFSVVWNTAALAEGRVSVGGTVFDRQGNRVALSAVSVTLDHTPPRVAAVYPSPYALNPTWITSSTSTMVRASASDTVAGVREVRFSAWYRDSNGVYREHVVGTAPRQNALGEYTVAWNTSGIPDQVDRHLPSELFVDVMAVDNAGNASYATGWIVGFDRAAPVVRVVSPDTTVHASRGGFPIEVQASDALGKGNAVAQLSVTARYREPGANQATSHLLARVANVTGWSGVLNLDNLPEQTVSIVAEARDEAGHSISHGGNIVVDRTAPTIGGLSHAPDPYYAGGGRTMSSSYRLSERADQVGVSIVDSAGAAVQELRFSNVNTDPQVAVWDGRDKNGNMVGSGSYTYHITAIDGAGNRGTYQGSALAVVVDTTAPSILLSVGPNPLTLDQVLKIGYRQDEPARAEIEVLNSAGQVIRYLGAWEEQAGIYSRSWDGTNASGTQVPAPATYTIRLRVVDPAGNAATTTASVAVQR